MKRIHVCLAVLVSVMMLESFRNCLKAGTIGQNSNQQAETDQSGSNWYPQRRVGLAGSQTGRLAANPFLE
jgi:hypothetical protein